MGTQTPWGLSDSEQVYARGIIFYGTPSHGGIHVSRKLNEQINPLWREANGWYEEDCAWAKVAVTFPQFFSEKEKEYSWRTVKEWYPDQVKNIFIQI